ncbi:MAG: hypothetical protein NTY08_07920 [Proteobacteria bacterium]|jgi:hypothetical protein|nr:hypothetical protein [Pseudomonadota bacterium]
MGRGDSRRSLLHRRRKAWRRKKLRLRSKIEAAQAASAVSTKAKKK